MSFLQPPAYVRQSVSSGAPVTHEWDGWDPYSVLPEPDDALMQRLEELSDRAMIAYETACAEWVTFRFSAEQIGDDLPEAFLQACWAFQMHKQFRAPLPFDEVDWKGPVRGAIDLALVTVLNTYYTTDEGRPAVQAAFADSLAAHVHNQDLAFREWRNLVVDRLTVFAKRSADDPWGLAVPREMFDPGIPMTSDRAATFVQDFLSSVDTVTNPLIVPIDGDNSR